MSESKPKSTKVQEVRETMISILLVFGVAAYFKVGSDIVFATYAALLGKTGVFMWGKKQEYQANTDVEVAKVQAVKP